MKRLIIYILVILLSIELAKIYGGTSINGGTVETNRIIKTIPLMATTNPWSLSSDNSMMTISYYDGLGRLVQTVNLTDDSDIVDYCEYDNRGRLCRQYQPTSGLTGGAYTPLSTVQSNSSVTYPNETMTYSTIEYYDMPENRIREQRSAGDAWQNATGVRHIIGMNLESGNYQCFRYVINSDSKLEKIGVYSSGELITEEYIDEDGCRKITFKDRLYNTLLERRFDSSDNKYDTYYVYDRYGNLCYVLSPMAIASLSDDKVYDDSEQVLIQLCYTYKYYRKNLLKSKRMPGSDWIYYGYDKSFRLVSCQDGNMRAKDARMIRYNTYDNLGRLATTGIYSYPRNISVHEFSYDICNFTTTTNFNVNQYAAFFGYVSVMENEMPENIQSVNYYDDYQFLSLFPQVSDSLIYKNITGYGSRYYTQGNKDISTQGLLTGRMKRIDDSNKLIIEVYYYDQYGRIIQTRCNNIAGGYDVVANKFDFSGRLLSEIKFHSISDSVCNVVKKNYTYDKIGHLLTVTMQIDGGTPTEILKNSYDEIGRLTGSSYPNNIGTTTYAYNIRGWLTEISNSYFMQKLYYSELPDGTTGLLNGNIAMQEFSLRESTSSNPRGGNMISGSYRYQYDKMNRLTQSTYTERQRTFNDIRYSGYSHDFSGVTYNTLYSYDLNSNIRKLQRRGLANRTIDTSIVPQTVHHNYALIDMITMTYAGNQLIRSLDTAIDCIYEGATDFADNASESVEYTYDSNGNMTSDLNKGIENIEYNVQNLPQTIIFSDGHRIHYSYDSDGNKLRVIYSIVSENVFTSEDGEITSGEESEDEWERSSVELQRTYIDEFVYESGTLERILTPNGYYKNGRYYFYIRDYQGNNRVTVSSSLRADTSTSGTVVQNNVISSSDAQAYYPYGVRFADVFKSNTDRYRYGGKEFDVMNDLQLYDFTARHYDPQLGRFTSPDPLQEKYYHLSPYCYALCNPILYVDPDGRDGIRVVDYENKTITIKANYYVQTKPMLYKNNAGKPALLEQYTSADISEFSKLNNSLNNSNFIVTTGNFKDYKVIFDLQFKDGGDYTGVIKSAYEDKEYEYSIGNSINKGNQEIYEGFKEKIIDEEQNIIVTIGGITNENKYITMNSNPKYGSEMNLLHEIFHTLGLDHPKGQGAENGIMAYPPEKVNQNDINLLINNKFLPIVIK